MKNRLYEFDITKVKVIEDKPCIVEGIYQWQTFGIPEYEETYSLTWKKDKRKLTLRRTKDKVWLYLENF